MKLSKVYIKAAELIDNYVYEFACLAIREVLKTEKTNVSQTDLFALYFKPEELKGSVWFNTNDTIEGEKEHRILSLLLMSEIAKEIEELTI